MTGEIPGDVVVIPERAGAWVVYNARSRACLGLDAAGLGFLADAASLTEEALLAKHEASRFRAWDIGRFTQSRGLLADPTRYIRDRAAWPEAKTLAGSELLALARKLCLLIADRARYAERFGPKKDLVDSKHFGNFHQQVGAELYVYQRANPEQWWVDQKFEKDRRSIRNNLYRAVQYRFLRDYFPKRIPAGSSVVDLGCGIGFYSDLLARQGAAVLGVDPNPDFIGAARGLADTKARFEVMPVGAPGGLDAVPSASADFIFMSDALLFYFVPPAPGQKADIDLLLKDIGRILKPEGTFISLEPHEVFYLAPWLGDVENPMTILTEYARKSFGVVPTLSQRLQAFCRNGFLASWSEELRPDPGFKDVDPRAYCFAEQFPLWHLIELVKRPS